MNPKFFSLPEDKQLAILNAGYYVFSRNTYRKSPTSDIADAAGISKALLFHYFRNKKELYLFLWDTCAEVTVKEMEACGCYEQHSLFDSMNYGMQAKMRISRRYPDMAMFAMKAFYEKDPEISGDIQRSMERYLSIHAKRKLQELNPDDFIPGIDLNMMYMEMYWSSEGYLWEFLQRGNTDVDEMERGFEKLLDFWKSVYLRKPQEETP